MKLVFLTNKCTHGVSLLNHLRIAGVDIAAILIDEGTDQLNEEELKRKAQRERVPKSLLNLTRKLRGLPTPPEWKLNGYYNRYTDNVIPVSNFNGEDCIEILRGINPDLIVLGGSRILKSSALEIPSIGVINAHPGILPGYRGVDVIPWAIHNNDTVGVTVHFVNAGVDTGDIIQITEMAVMHGDSIQDLEDRAIELAGEMTAEVVRNLAEHGRVETLPNPKSQGKQYYAMPIDLRKQVEQKLKND